MDAAAKVANLQAYLKLVGMNPLSKRDAKDAEEAEYLVLYSARDDMDKFIVAHFVKNFHTAECMVEWEIYGRVRVINLSDSSVVVEKQRPYYPVKGL